MWIRFRHIPCRLKHSKQWLCLLICLMAFSQVQSLPDDRQQPIEIEADLVAIDEKNNYTTYSGNVILTQGSILLAADTLTVYIGKQKIKQIRAQGRPVDFQQQTEKSGLVEGQASLIEFRSGANIIRLSGQAKLKQQDSQWRGNVLEYDVSSGLLLSKQRSKTIIPAASLGNDN